MHATPSLLASRAFENPEAAALFALVFSVASWLDALFLGIALVLGMRYLLDFSSHYRTIRATVMVTLVLLVIQSVGAKYADVGMQARTTDPAAMSMWARTNVGSTTGNLVAPFLMGIPHLVLTSQCVRFARSSGLWGPLRVNIFAVCLYASTIICFLSGTAYVIDIYLSAVRPDLPKFILPAISINLILSALLDLMLAGTLTYELRESRSRVSSLSSSAIIESLSHVLLSNGVILAIYQIVTSCLYFTTHFGPVIVIPLTLLGKIYAITMLLAIMRPLSARRQWQSTGGEARAAQDLSDEETRIESERRRKASHSTTTESTTVSDKKAAWRQMVRRGSSKCDPLQLAPVPGEPVSFESFFSSQGSTAKSPLNTPAVEIAPDSIVAPLSHHAANHGLDLEYVLGALKDGDDVVAAVEAGTVRASDPRRPSVRA